MEISLIAQHPGLRAKKFPLNNECFTIDGYSRKIYVVDANLLVNLFLKDADFFVQHHPEYKSKFSHGLTEIEKYCIVRLASSCKIYEPGLYDVVEEEGWSVIDSDSEVWIDFLEEVSGLLSIDDEDEMIRHVLMKEYGYLLQRLKEVHFFVKEIDISYIKEPVDLRRCAGEVTTGPEDLPIGIYEAVGSSYRIVDGHHRWAHAVSAGRKKVKVLVFE
jgi:hypothetical protein